MKIVRAVGRMSLGVAVLGIIWTATASSQGRTSGRSRNPDESNRTAVTPTPNPSPVRDIGRTRQSEAGSPTQVPSGSSGGRRGGPSSGAGHETPPPRVERQPIYRQPQHDSPPVPPPPPPGNCGDGFDIGGGLPNPEPGGVWIRGGVNFGRNVTLSDMRTMPEYSGYDFSDLLKRPYDDPFTDMAVESDSWGDLYMAVREDTEIMDLGVAGVPADVIYIPRREWSADHSVRLDDGHEYVVRTWDGHYAKFLVTSLENDRVTFDWAYQYGEGPLAYYRVTPVREERFMRFAR